MKTNRVHFDKFNLYAWNSWNDSTSIMLSDFDDDFLMSCYERATKLNAGAGRHKFLTAMLKSKMNPTILDNVIKPWLFTTLNNISKYDGKTDEQAEIYTDYIGSASILYLTGNILRANKSASFESMLETCESDTSFATSIKGNDNSKIKHAVKALDIAVSYLRWKQEYKYRFGLEIPYPTKATMKKYVNYVDMVKDSFSTDVFDDDTINTLMETFDTMQHVDYVFHNLMDVRILRSAVETCFDLGINFIELSLDRQMSIMNNIAYVGTELNNSSDEAMLERIEDNIRVFDATSNYIPTPTYYYNPEKHVINDCENDNSNYDEYEFEDDDDMEDND